ncbi:MAG: hypothetical protein IPP64_01725 [Bacteroidetes bacterium]|nr:hypothetical protein [Bacteroidota bacterium]
MKKLTSEEYNQLPIRGKGRSSHVFNSIVNLQVGEALLIEKSDWKRKASPSTLVRYIEKNHDMRFTCGSLAGGSGWAVRRIDGIKKETAQKETPTPTPTPAPTANNTQDADRLQLKSDLVVFYLGRMAFHKIERIEDSIKASVGHFWKSDSTIIKELFGEIIKSLEEQGHIVIENGKTYIPLRRN